MKNEISKVYKNSIAEEVDIEVGDRLLSINGNKVKDIIDYKFLIVDEEVLLEIQKKDEEIWEIEIEKEYSEDIGIEFKEAIMDNPKSCHNKCVFCFIDQLPKGLRETLYFKDDDSRLSFLQGNFITLTNMSDEDIDRIIRYRISPINVSVHTTNPELRVKMLNNKFAGRIYERLVELAKADIKINCQIVLCPYINDGKELINTIEDLYKLYPSIENVAVVPIGLTKFREGLKKIELFDKERSQVQINEISKLQSKYFKETGSNFVRLSDEFYVMAELDVPEAEFYNDYDQLEDGIGMIRNFRENIKDTLKDLNKNLCGNFTIATGASAYNEILKASKDIMSVNKKINIKVVKILNHFFGETITVAGLLTGGDIINQLKNENQIGTLIMADNMFKKDYELGDYKENIMLDNITVDDIQKELNTKVIICDYTGNNMIELINKHCEEE